MDAEKKSRLLVRAIESLPDCLLTTDKDGFINYMNPPAERITEWKREEAVGKNLGEVFNIKTEDAITVDSSVRQKIRSQALLIRKSGSEIPIDYSASILPAEAGEVLGYVVVFRDITEYKALDDALKISRRKYKQLVNSINGIVWEADAVTHDFSFVSKNAQKLTGYPLERWLTPGFWKDSLHPEDREDMIQFHATAVTKRRRYEQEYRLMASDGTPFWVRDTVHAIIGESPNLKMQGILMDITESKFTEKQLQRLEKALETTPVGVTITDAAGVIVFTNRAEAEMHGYSVQDVIAKEAAIFSHPEQRRGVSLDQLKEFGAWQREGTNIRKDGSVFPVQLISDVVRTGDGEPIGLVTCSLDISAQKQAQESEREAQAWKRSILESALDCIVSMDEKGNIVEFNPTAEKTFGYRSSEVIGSPMAEKIIPPPLRQRYYRALEQYLATGKPKTLDKRVEFTALRADGSEFPVELTVTRIHGTERPKFTAYIRDVSERKHAEERLLHQAYHDSLTGLPNRVLYRDRLQIAIARAERLGTPVVIMFLDLDQFKLINDTLGHDIGDWLLGEVAKRLKEVVRNADTLSRSGGDEFMFLFNEIGHTQDAARLAEKILNIIAEPFHHENHTFKISASVGISIYPGDGRDPDTLIKNADNAGYRAKELGRNKFQFSNAALSERTFKRLFLEQGLRRAVERSEFIVHYQPQLNIQKGVITGVEALVRWQHPERGLVSASEFVWLAEETDMMGTIGEFVLRDACNQMKRWHEKGFSELRISVNLSARQFQEPGLVEKIENLLKESGLEPSYLVLEITETIAMHDLYRTHSILQELVKKGIRIALDDFGVGYSSLNYLKHFPIHIIKVDRSFVRDLASQEKDLAFIQAIISIARTLNKSIIIEGVETKEQLSFLKQLECEEIQGNLFSPAVTPEVVQGFLEHGRHESFS